jgi:hypothetical protein
VAAPELRHRRDAAARRAETPNTRSNVSETDAGCESVNAIVAGFLELRRWTIGVTPNPVRTGGVDVVVVAAVVNGTAEPLEDPELLVAINVTE